MDREKEVAELVRLLERLRSADERPVVGTANPFYPLGRGRWSTTRIRKDLWERGCGAVQSGSLPRSAVQLWGHWYGISDGYVRSRVEIRRRFRIGRFAAETVVERVNRAVAESLRRVPPSRTPPVTGAACSRAALEDGAAVALGRAVTEQQRHRAEIRYALYDILERGAAETATAAPRRLPNGWAARKPNLKTTRHAPAARTALHRAAADSALRRLDSTPGVQQAVLPLWEPVDPTTTDLEQALRELRRLGPAGDRDSIVQILQDGHHHILRRPADRELICDFLFLESEILGQHENIGRAAILEVLEHLLDPADPRRVDTARERVHILERHHYWAAARAWTERVWQRLRDPRIRWADADDKRVAVVRALERQTSLAAKLASVSAETTGVDLSAMARRTRRVLDLVGDPARTREWRHVAQRRELQVRWATKNRDRLLGLPAHWDDDELAAIEAIDRTAPGLGMPVRVLCWNNQKLNVLLTADRPADFLHTVECFLPILVALGATWPSQVCATRSVLELAARQRSARWRNLRPELAAWMDKLPAHTDAVLRNPYAIPRHLVVNGVSIG